MNNNDTSFLQEHSLAPGYILYVGNIEPRKNISTLIDAYMQLSSAFRQDRPLVLVGSAGWKNESVLARIAAAQLKGFDIRHITKFISEEALYQIYASAAVLVHPALYEGFGMTPLEAMAAGTPTIVANNSSLPEVVGDASLLIDALDAADISAKIKEVVQDEEVRRKLIENGRQRVRQFTWQRSASELLDTVEETL